VLYLVLILVIMAFGLLIAALTTAHTLWAWISVAISAVAAGLLIFDWLRGRRRVAATSAPRAAEDDLETLAFDDPGDSGDTGDAVEERAPAEPERAEPTAEIPPVVEPVVQAEPAEAQPEAEAEFGDDEPGEEATDATDLLIVSELNVEVRVVDEHPRYHLARCTWLIDKPTLSLPVSEARQLGFTPCLLCCPDAVLASRHRASRGAKQ
jgi:hypothetical protein